MTVKQISVQDLQQRLNNEDALFLLDVREIQEFEFAQIKGSVLIPLSQIPQQLNNLNKEDEIIVICHHGMRSQQAADYMESSGFTHLSNLVGGIDRWALECDKTMPRY